MLTTAKARSRIKLATFSTVNLPSSVFAAPEAVVRDSF